MLSLQLGFLVLLLNGIFPPVLGNFPINPNSIRSPLAWNPLSTGVGKLRPGTLQAWWDASTLNANDLFWGYPNWRYGQLIYQASGTLNSNTLVIHGSDFLKGATQPGMLIQLEGDPQRTTYTIEALNNPEATQLTVSPPLQQTFTNANVYVAQISLWPDLSGNRRHFGSWAFAHTFSPSLYLAHTTTGRLFVDGFQYNTGIGQQLLTEVDQGFSIGSVANGTWPYPGGRVAVHEFIIATGVLDENQTRWQLEGYLAHKWGFQHKLDAQHPYLSAPPANWSPAQLGNTVQIWLDAQRPNSFFTDASCTTPAAVGSTIACWQDASAQQRHFTQNDTNAMPRYDQAQGLPSLIANTNQFLSSANANWINQQNFFIAAVVERLDSNGLLFNNGPIHIRSSSSASTRNDWLLFPFFHTGASDGFDSSTLALAGNTTTFKTNIMGYTGSRPALAIKTTIQQHNDLITVYKPYFSGTRLRSSLFTRENPSPMYLNDKPLLIALVANYLVLPLPPVELLPGKPSSADFFSIIAPQYPSVGGRPGRSELSFGFNGEKFWFAPVHWNTYYNFTSTTQPEVYLAWLKTSNQTATVTISGSNIELLSTSSQDNFGYLNIQTTRAGAMAIGDRTSSYIHGFFGSIYEVIVITGDIRYGHQRLIEGYLAWKWGLQKRLPKRHSYYHVPPAR
jgi:hypothetical protein